MIKNAVIVTTREQEITANCEKYIRATDTQVYLTSFPSEFKFVKPFVLLSLIFESTDRNKIFHMTRSWQLHAVVACAELVVIWSSEIELRQNKILLHSTCDWETLVKWTPGHQDNQIRGK